MTGWPEARCHADRLRDEIAALSHVMEANQAAADTWSESVAELEATWARSFAIHIGISDYDADHPCKAIARREQELRALCPDIVLREMGAPMLPGMDAPALVGAQSEGE